MLTTFFFFFENRAVYKIMWKNIVERSRPQKTIWRMRIACWITEVINTGLEYMILIALPLHQWLHKHASILRYTYTACLDSLLCRSIETRWLFGTYKQSLFPFSFTAFAVRLIVLCRFPMQWAETNYRVYLMHSFCKYFCAAVSEEANGKYKRLPAHIT